MENKFQLHDAASNGDTATVQTLIRKGADANLKDKNGLTPLHRFARQIG